MKYASSVAVVVALAICSAATAQDSPLPQPGPEFDFLKADVGSWDVEIKTWAGPGESTVTRGKETNRMLGGFWLLADFQGKMMGLDFKGHGMYSYDTQKKHYVGIWVDSLSATKMDMVGKRDAANHTMTYEGIGPGSDGKPAKHVMTTKYAADGNRVMTMHVDAGGQMMKVFEMSYTRAAK
jgi:hypothetical protein